jgi:hypothetical protein
MDSTLGQIKDQDPFLRWHFTEGSEEQMHRWTKTVVHTLINWDREEVNKVVVRYRYIWSPPQRYGETIDDMPGVQVLNVQRLMSSEVALIGKVLLSIKELNKLEIVIAPYLSYSYDLEFIYERPSEIEFMNSALELEKLPVETKRLLCRALPSLEL